MLLLFYFVIFVVAAVVMIETAFVGLALDKYKVSGPQNVYSCSTLQMYKFLLLPTNTECTLQDCSKILAHYAFSFFSCICFAICICLRVFFFSALAEFLVGNKKAVHSSLYSPLAAG